MNKKLLAVVLLLPVLLLGVLFTVNYVAIGNLIDDPLRISFANPVEFVQVGEEKNVTVLTTPHDDKWQEDIVYEVDDKSLLSIEGHTLTGLKEGKATLTAYYDSGVLLDRIPVYVVSSNSSALYALDLTSSLSGIASSHVYGRYDLDADLQLVDATIELGVFDYSACLQDGDQLIPSHKAKQVSIQSGSGSIAYNDESDRYEVIVKGNQDIVISFINSQDEETCLTLPIIEEGINVRSYRDLAYATNHHDGDNPICLQTSLENLEQATDSEGNPLRNVKPLGLSEEEKNQLDQLGDGTKYLLRSFKSGDLYYEYAETESTYDTRFLKKLNQSTSLIEALTVHQDIYGNGYSLNFHDLTFPTGKSTNVGGQEKVALSKSDIYRGPLSFCGVSLSGDKPQVTVNGEDNIILGVHADNLIISNLTVFGANNRPYVTDYEYGGTILSVKGVSNLTIEDSVLQNARNGIRCFSSENVTIDNCLIRNCRDYLIRLGSDEYKEQTHQATANENYPENERIDTTVTVNDTYFANSGFFSIGVETHFDGEFLYDTVVAGFQTNDLFMGTLPLGGTSKGVKLMVTGDTRFYDWKLISAVSSSAFLQINEDLAGFDQLLEALERFDLIPIITRELSKPENAPFLIEEGDRIKGQVDPDATYVNTALAFYGGGLVNSVSDFDDQALGLHQLNVELSASETTDQLLRGCIGPSPFEFHLYQNDNPIQPGDTPSLGELSERA